MLLLSKPWLLPRLKSKASRLSPEIVVPISEYSLKHLDLCLSIVRSWGNYEPWQIDPFWLFDHSLSISETYSWGLQIRLSYQLLPLCTKYIVLSYSMRRPGCSSPGCDSEPSWFVQVFKANCSISVNPFSAYLLGKVIPSVSYSFI